MSIQTLRTAAIVGMLSGHAAMIAYARALPADDASLTIERDLFLAEAAAAKFSPSSCKSMWSAIARIATGKADGDGNGATLAAVAYATQTPDAKKAAATAKATTGKRAATPMAVVAAFMSLTAAERKETLVMLNNLPK